MKSILLVEDDRMVAHSLTRALASAGYDVTLARSVADGYLKASQSAYDLMLFDIGLPDGSGLELAHRLRAEKNVSLIIFLTAYKDEVVVRAAIDLGAHSYLVKPILATQLLPVVASALAVLDREAEKTEKLVAALNVGRETSIAVGILAERQQCSPEAAFEELRHQARSRKMKIEALAQEIIDGHGISRST